MRPSLPLTAALAATSTTADGADTLVTVPTKTWATESASSARCTTVFPIEERVGAGCITTIVGRPFTVYQTQFPTHCATPATTAAVTSSYAGVPAASEFPSSATEHLEKNIADALGATCNGKTKTYTFTPTVYHTKTANNCPPSSTSSSNAGSELRPPAVFKALAKMI